MREESTGGWCGLRGGETMKGQPGRPDCTRPEKAPAYRSPMTQEASPR